MMTVAKKPAKGVSKTSVKKTKSAADLSKDKSGLKQKLLKALKSGKYSEDMISKLKSGLGFELDEKPNDKGSNGGTNTPTNAQRKRKRKLEDENLNQSDGHPSENVKKRARKLAEPSTSTNKEKGRLNNSKEIQKPKSILKKSAGGAKEESENSNEETLSKRKLKLKQILEKKIKPENLSKKERRALRVMRRKDGDLVQRLLTMWEEMRDGNCAPERRSELCSAMLADSTGRISQLVLAHDTARVFETILKLGSVEQRLRVLEELQGEETMRGLMQSKFGKYVLQKMLMHGSGRHKERVFAAIEGNVVKLFHHRQGLFILNSAFNDYATASQRENILQELYGPPFSLFKQSGVSRLADAFANNPNTDKKAVLENVKSILLKAIVKGNINYLLFHTLLLDFFENCSEADRTELVQALREHIVALLHTREGVKAAMTVLWYSNNKDRKSILRSMKTFFPNTAVDEHGYLFILSILDAVDDIVILSKLVLKELFDSLETLIVSPHGRKVILYMLSRRSQVHFHPQLIDILRKGDSNPYTKKSSDIRNKELRERILPPLVNFVSKNIKLVCTPNNALMVLRELLVVGAVEKVDGYSDLVAELVRLIVNDEHVCADGKESIIENSGSHIALKRALHESKAEGGDLGEQLLKHLSGKSLEKLLVTNRGCFLLVALCETTEEFVDKLSQILKPDIDKLLKQKTSGANILRKKLSM